AAQQCAVPKSLESPAVISTEVLDGINVVRLERSALVPGLLKELVEQLKLAGASRRPVILTNAGPAFCVGADLNWLASLRDPALGVADLVAVHHLAISTLVEMPVPGIGGGNGAVAGGGLG